MKKRKEVGEMMKDVNLSNLLVLVLDQANTPSKWWGTVEEVVGHHARGDILWASDPVAVLRGGHNKDGNQSLFEVPIDYHCPRINQVL